MSNGCAHSLYSQPGAGGYFEREQMPSLHTDNDYWWTEALRLQGHPANRSSFLAVTLHGVCSW